MKSQCPVCGEFAVGPETEMVRSHRKGKEISYTSHYSECHACELVFVTDADMRLNNRALLAAESAADGLPSAKEIRNWRKVYSLTQKDAGELLGVGPSAFSKYENYELRPSAPTEHLLYVMLHVEEAVHKLAKKNNVLLRSNRSEKFSAEQFEPDFEGAELLLAATRLHNQYSPTARVLSSVNLAKQRGTPDKHEFTYSA